MSQPCCLTTDAAPLKVSISSKNERGRAHFLAAACLLFSMLSYNSFSSYKITSNYTHHATARSASVVTTKNRQENLDENLWTGNATESAAITTTVPSNDSQAPTQALTTAAPNHVLQASTEVALKAKFGSLVRVENRLLDLDPELKKEWGEIYERAFRVSETAFCLDWSVPSDHWWTHHPEWEISEETDSHYCFQYISNDPKRTDYLRQLYENQFHGNCSNQFPLKMYSSGWNADTQNVLKNLDLALLSKRPLQINRYPWHYAAPDVARKGNKVPSPPACPTFNMNCYFLNISNCPSLPTFARRLPLQETRHRRPHVNWLREYITRPQLWLRKEIRAYVKTQERTMIRTPCTAIHVRRGDVILHGKQSRKYHAIAEYLNTTVIEASSFQLKHNIFLLTDDDNAIGEATTLFPDFHWMYLDRPRFKADQGGWEHQLPSSKPIFEMVVLQSIFQLIQQCDSLVRTGSGFGRLLEYYIRKGNSTAQILDLDRNGVQRSIYNNATKVISKEYTNVTSLVA